MNAYGIAIVAVFTAGYALLSKRLSTTPLTGPLICVVFGLIMGP